MIWASNLNVLSDFFSWLFEHFFCDIFTIESTWSHLLVTFIAFFLSVEVIFIFKIIHAHVSEAFVTSNVIHIVGTLFVFFLLFLTVFKICTEKVDLRLFFFNNLMINNFWWRSFWLWSVKVNDGSFWFNFSKLNWLNWFTMSNYWWNWFFCWYWRYYFLNLHNRSWSSCWYCCSNLGR